MNKQRKLINEIMWPDEQYDPDRCAATYSRYSTVLQKDTSIEDQARGHDDYVAKHNLMIRPAHRFADAAKSGQRVAPRQALMSLINIATTGSPPFNHLIVESTSRLGRNMRETLQVVETLMNKNIIIHFVHQSLRTDSKDWNRFLGVYALVDEWQITTIRDCSMRGMIGQIRRGYSAGLQIYGFRSVPQYSPDQKTKYGEPKRIGNRLEPVPEEVEIVRHIFRRRVEYGWSCQKIADELNGRITHE